MATPESKVKKAVKRILKERGCYFFMPVQMGYGMRSVDFLVCWRGRFLGIECKRAGVTEASKFQQQTLNEITVAGGIAVTINDPCQLIELFLVLETTRATSLVKVGVA